MSKFALLVARTQDYQAEVKRDVVQEAYEALRTLGHTEADARKLLDSVLKAKRKFADVEEVLQAIYQQSHGRPE
jgi:Holliday junction DNA helicase RuvA